MNRGAIIGIVSLLAIGAILLFVVAFPGGPQTPTATQPELFSTVEDTDGIPETPSNVEGITADSQGNMYVGLLAERVVVKITQSGEQSVFAVIPDQGALLGLATDDEDNIYVADFNFFDPQNSCNCIRKITPEGEVSIFASGIPTPNGLAFDSDGNLYVTASFQGAIYKIDPSGNVELFSDHDLIKSHDPEAPFGANGIAISDDGTIYVANMADATIIKISDNDVSIFGTEGDFPGADGLILDSAGNLYIAQNIINTISALTPEGEQIVIAQNEDSDGSNGELESPASLVFYEDRLYVTNADFQMDTNSETEPPYTISVLEIGIQGQ